MRLRALTTVLAAAAALAGPAAAEPSTLSLCVQEIGCAVAWTDPDQPGTSDVHADVSGMCVAPAVACLSHTPGRTKTINWSWANAVVSCAVSKYSTTVSIDVGPRDSDPPVHPVEVWATCRVHQYGVLEGAAEAYGYSTDGVTAHATGTERIGPLTNDAVVGCLTARIAWSDGSWSHLPPCDDW